MCVVTIGSRSTGAGKQTECMRLLAPRSTRRAYSLVPDVPRPAQSGRHSPRPDQGGRDPRDVHKNIFGTQAFLRRRFLEDAPRNFVREISGAWKPSRGPGPGDVLD